MKKDEKRLLREIKRQIKEDGNRSRRRYLQRQLMDDPENAHLEDDYDYKYNSSTHFNGLSKDSTRIKEEYEQQMFPQDNEEEEQR